MNAARVIRATHRIRGAAFYSTNSSYNFDTYRFVNRLESESFERERAEAIMTSLNDVVHESVTNITKNMVLKSEMEKSHYQTKVDFAQVRTELQLLEQNQYAILRADTQRLSAEADKLRRRVYEELRRVQSSVRLEMSLEKGRIRDEQASQELKVREAASRVDSEVANLRTQLEGINWELFRTLVPLFCAFGGLFFAYLRLVK
ncbi:hypothetical protein SmJEL517_g04921 [Synchytrium microbalum]|uniref:DUF1640 domain-containing protein n=1 Tax=Synchytrium microbalum TaxID=1806994 RepID=A0A507BWK9_9FUNG|nr:uncharacterized protein SmJEL517_g04921 [Synchytrium microbalum]TPX31842.1 hypothetical protein SmJEL517_g04921 [Synchytrium microbalum]